MSTIGLQENGSSIVRVVELPKSDRKVAPVETAKIALTGKATTEVEGIKVLETMFKAAIIGYARKQNTLREAIEACEKAGVSMMQMQTWANEVGFSWSKQTFANVTSQIRKDRGELIKIVRREDKRLARNRKTPQESSAFDRHHAYLLSEMGTLAAARKEALALARRFESDIKEAAKKETK